MSSPGAYEQRFSGIQRLVGDAKAQRLKDSHVCVVGIGGVGSWAAESLARTGIGRITLIDWDDICYSNVNRQIHAMTGVVGQAKVEVMAERIRAINPECEVRAIRDYFNGDNKHELVTEQKYDGLIDAIDQLNAKCWLIAASRRAKIPIVSCGAVGGMVDPSRLQVSDLNHSYADPLLAAVRKKLKRDFGFSKKEKSRFNVECVFSPEDKVFPRDDGTVCASKLGVNQGNIGCDFGYGSASFITGTAAFLAVSRIIHHITRKVDVEPTVKKKDRNKVKAVNPTPVSSENSES
jgi:tRNA A37 threonylcarbamoyladenosine dehydratase